MAELTITHTHAEGTLIDGTAKGDGTNVILKENGWRWSSQLGSWYIRSSRDRQPQQWKIEATKAALEAAGHTVALELDVTVRPTAEVEADKAVRQDARAEALAAKADRQDQESTALYERARDMASVIPFGQPILTDHYSAPRDRRYRGRISDTYDKAFTLMHEQEETQRRADAAARTTAARYNPVTVANRIEKLEAEIRKFVRERDGVPGQVIDSPWGPVDTSKPAAGPERQKQLQGWIDEKTEQVEYWKGIRAQQQADGVATSYSKGNVQVGGMVKHRFGWSKIARVNAKTVSVETEYSWTDRLPYAEIQGYRPPADEAAAG